MKKKLFVIFLSLVMVVTMMPLSVFADTVQIASNTKESTAKDNENSTPDYFNLTPVEGVVVLGFDKGYGCSLEYSFDKEHWNGDYEKMTLEKGQTVYFRGNNSPGKEGIGHFKEGVFQFGLIEADGNIMSLIDKTCSSKNVPDYAFKNLFSNMYDLTKTPKLPGTNLGKYCYESMFDGCSRVECAPELPAKTLGEGCYKKMFNNCYNLHTPPKLPSTTLKEACYENMFSNCGLEFAPELPAKKLVEGCYKSMFSGCTGLETAPKLPAETLVKECYYEMFSGCYQLDSVMVNFSNWNENEKTTYKWLENNWRQGMFFCPSNLNVRQSDSSHVPTDKGWTVVKSQPPQVKGLNAMATDSKTNYISWDKIENYTGLKYEVWRKAGSGSWSKIATTSSRSFKDTKVKTGTKYYYKVRAVNVFFGKTYYGTYSKTDYGYPRLFQVTGISAKALNAAKAQITWKANGNKNVYYQVYISTKSNKGFKKVATIRNGKTTYTQKFTPTQSGKKYYFKVRAITKDYTGKWHYGKFSKVDYAYPRVNTPTNFKAWAASKHTCKCSWGKVPGSNIKYLVYRGTKPTGNWGKAKAITSKTSFTNKHMRSGHKYYYMVRAVQTINGKKYYSDYSAKDYAYPR